MVPKLYDVMTLASINWPLSTFKGQECQCTTYYTIFMSLTKSLNSLFLGIVLYFLYYLMSRRKVKHTYMWHWWSTNQACICYQGHSSCVFLGGSTLHTTHELTWVQGGVFFEALVYVGYIRERYGLSPVCTSEKAINLFKVKVDVRKGGA